MSTVELSLNLNGKILYLTKNPNLIKAQLAGTNFTEPPSQDDLADNISTDDIAPASLCYQDADPTRLSTHLLQGFFGVIGENGINTGDYEVLAAGRSFGRGSSREHAQRALSRIKLLILGSSERIFRDNCINYNLPILPYSAPEAYNYLRYSQPIPVRCYLQKLPRLSRLVMECGGLMEFTRKRLQGEVSFQNPYNALRPQFSWEKIVAKHAGVPSLIPGEQYLVRLDKLSTYEIQSAVTDQVLSEHHMTDFPLYQPDHVYVFEDHLALLYNQSAKALRLKQQALFRRLGVTNIFPVDPILGVEGINHTVMVDYGYVRPGDVVLCSDSHACSKAVTGAFAIGKGVSELAAALFTGDTLLTAPETIQINLQGQLKKGVTAKDLILYIISRDQYRKNFLGSNRVLHLSGEGLDSISFDGQFTLANMSIEGQFFTASIEPNVQTKAWFSSTFPNEKINWSELQSDSDAVCTYQEDIDLEMVEPMIALPGDSQNAVALSQIKESIPIDIVYIGSCTNRREDIMQVATILDGKTIDPKVRCFIQTPSRRIQQELEKLGILARLKQTGATILSPGCGACMGAGPGSSNGLEVIFSTTNRNFDRRMGGPAYLGSAITAAQVALRGYL